MGRVSPFLNPRAFPIAWDKPAQLAICSGVGNAARSAPVSAKIVAAESWPIPGTFATGQTGSQTELLAYAGVFLSPTLPLLSPDKLSDAGNYG
jgi:hypothetical protein